MTTQTQGLSNAERILLAEELWDSVTKDDNLFNVSDAQKQLLDLRLNQYLSDKDAGASWHDVKNRISGG